MKTDGFRRSDPSAHFDRIVRLVDLAHEMFDRARRTVSKEDGEEEGRPGQRPHVFPYLFAGVKLFMHCFPNLCAQRGHRVVNPAALFLCLFLEKVSWQAGINRHAHRLFLASFCNQILSSFNTLSVRLGTNPPLLIFS